MINKELELEEFVRREYGFASHAVMSGAVHFHEFLRWVDLMIETYDNLPTFVFDLIDTKNISEAEKFAPRHCYSGLSGKESEVLRAIAVRRFPDRDKDLSSITPKTALKRLEQYPHVVERFKKTFPFIKLDF